MGIDLQHEWANVAAAPFTYLAGLIAAGLLVWALLHFLYKVKIDRLEQDVRSEQAEVGRLRARIEDYESLSPDGHREKAEISRLRQRIQEWETWHQAHQGAQEELGVLRSRIEQYEAAHQAYQSAQEELGRLRQIIQQYQQRDAAAAPPARRLTPEQKKAIGDILRGSDQPWRGVEMRVQCARKTPESWAYAKDLTQAMRLGGWQSMEPEADSEYTRVGLHRGLTLRVEDAKKPPPWAKILGDALVKADVEFKWESRPHSDYGGRQRVCLYVDPPEDPL